MTTRALWILLLAVLTSGCGSMLPRSKEVSASPWQTYQDAEQAFDKIVPGKTTFAELRDLALDPAKNANISVLNYSDVLRRFLANQSMSMADLDDGVIECVTAKVKCRGFEINQRSLNKHRNGNFFLDLLGFQRETHTAGWRFNGLILLRDDVVVYKLTGGQPVIQETVNEHNPLGPVQALGQRFLGIGAP